MYNVSKKLVYPVSSKVVIILNGKIGLNVKCYFAE